MPVCGIAGFHIKDKAKGTIEAGYLLDWLLVGIEHRGKEATGYLSLGFDGSMTLDKAPTAANEFIQKRKAIPSMPRTILGHTRLATQGDPKFAENNHPVHYGTTFVTHNGWIVNDDQIFRDHGMERTAEVDTISIPAILWNFNEGGGFKDTDTALALEKLDGAMAIAAVDITTPDTLLLARGNNSPLFFFENDKIIIWASTIHAIQQAWGKVFGTPPAKERFQEFEEGEFRIIKAGVTVHEGVFEPSWGVRYNWGYSGYTSTQAPTGLDSDWYSELKRQQDEDDAQAVSTKGGTWLTLPDGSRTFMPVGEGVGETVEPLTKADIEVLRTMKDWAKMDAEAHENTVWDLSSMLQIDMVTAAWILYYADIETINANPVLEKARKYMEFKYGELYNLNIDQLLADAAPDDSPPAPALKSVVMCEECGVNEADYEDLCTACRIMQTVRVAPMEATRVNEPPLLETANLNLTRAEGNGSRSWECIRCHENDTEDFVDFYCSSCIGEMAMADDG